MTQRVYFYVSPLLDTFLDTVQSKLLQNTFISYYYPKIINKYLHDIFCSTFAGQKMLYPTRIKTFYWQFNVKYYVFPKFVETIPEKVCSLWCHLNMDFFISLGFFNFFKFCVVMIFVLWKFSQSILLIFNILTNNSFRNLLILSFQCWLFYCIWVFKYIKYLLFINVLNCLRIFYIYPYPNIIEYYIFTCFIHRLWHILLAKT